jgi:hypothetical protein
MGVTRFTGAGLAREDGYERSGLFRIRIVRPWASREAFQGGLDSSEVIEGVKAVRAAAKLARCLRTAQQQQAKDSSLVAAEVEDGPDTMLVLGDAGVADRVGEGEIFKRVERLPNLLFRKLKDGLPAGALITRIDQCVKRERIVLRGSDLFFDQRAENAKLDGVELHVY